MFFTHCDKKWRNAAWTQLRGGKMLLAAGCCVGMWCSQCLHLSGPVLVFIQWSAVGCSQRNTLPHHSWGLMSVSYLCISLFQLFLDGKHDSEIADRFWVLALTLCIASMFLWGTLYIELCLCWSAVGQLLSSISLWAFQRLIILHRHAHVSHVMLVHYGLPPF